MDWFTAFVENSKSLPLTSQASVLMALTWGVVDGEQLTVESVSTRDAQRRWADGQFVEGLQMAVVAGWLAPLVWGAGGELRTALRIPAGIGA
jgi:hypothetical protein